MLVACWVPVLLSACGFHLRGSANMAMPQALKHMRVVVADSKLANEPLRLIAANVLQSDTDVLVSDDPGVPVLLLSGELTNVDVIAVNISGRASAYTMTYEVMYRVMEAGGRTIVPFQRVRLLRDFTFDPVNVLAKEREEQDLKRSMQREAVQQIVRRLSRHVVPDKPNATRP
jgi:LPS-assembly lipoprotein